MQKKGNKNQSTIRKSLTTLLVFCMLFLSCGSITSLENVCAVNAEETAVTEDLQAREDSLLDAAEDNMLSTLQQSSVPTTVDNDSATSEEIKAANSPIIVLDPGHGLWDSGACRGSLKENVINAKIAKACKAELEAYGATVYMTHPDENTRARYEDDNGTKELQARVAVAKKYNANLLVSLHNNAASGTSAKGAEIYYPKTTYRPALSGIGKSVANFIIEKLGNLGLVKRGVFTRDYGDGYNYPDGSEADYYGIIRYAKLENIPAILVEHAFLSNSQDYALLADDNFLYKLGVADAEGIAQYYGLKKGEWVEDENGWRWKENDGNFRTNSWLKVNGKQYLLDEEGYCRTGFYKDGNNLYYFDPVSCAMHIGWSRLDGSWYYFKSDGAAAVSEWMKLSNKWYYFDADAKMVTGLQEINGKKYYLLESEDSSKEGVMQTGWRKLDGIWYYFKTGNDSVAGKAAASEWMKIGNKWYYFDSDAKMVTGFKEINGKTYYFTESPDSSKEGAMVTGKITVDGTNYVFNSDGALVSSSQANQKNGWVEENGKTYYYADGAKVTGWKQISGERYYFADPSGIMQTGEQVINGTTYYFYSSGKYIEDAHQISGSSDVTAQQLANYYTNAGKTFPEFYKNDPSGATNLLAFCQVYVDEAAAEGIKVEVAFAQAMKETNWLNYGGDVPQSYYNFGGLGATGGVPGNQFESVRIGVRAQIQHLKAYANKEALNQTCVDVRFSGPTRGSAPIVEWLGVPDNPYGKGWATAKNYGSSIITMMNAIKASNK